MSQPVKKNGTFQKPRSKTVRKRRKQIVTKTKTDKEDGGDLKT